LGGAEEAWLQRLSLSRDRVEEEKKSTRGSALYVLILSYGISLYAYVSVMVIISRALIEWCIGEPMPVFFYHILHYH